RKRSRYSPRRQLQGCSFAERMPRDRREIKAARGAKPGDDRECRCVEANLKPTCDGEYFARRFYPSSFRELLPSSVRNCVCSAERGLSNFLPPSPTARCRCPRSELPTFSPPTCWSYTDR